MTYKLSNQKPEAIWFNPGPDAWLIPVDPANMDYQQYLAWLEEGNEPLPADD